MVTTVRGRLSSGFSAIDCIQHCFPAGSMTGAPKRRSMHILDRIEQAPRGVYSGALGLIGFNGVADLNVVIRTAISTPQGTYLGVGGAVISQSSAEEEHAEMLLKAKVLLEVISYMEGSGRKPSS
eukprot:GILI01077089.1.p1 GENE.GILI01077089.1~~GILI01077089.1.p1  ORF type:complete len:140 (-),score=33.05 GILI01077089.1:31-405(-)